MTATPKIGSMSTDAASVLTDSRVAGQHAAGALILVARIDPVGLVFASAAAAAMFGADDLERLSGAVFSSGHPGGVRLAHLARTMEPNRPARLERLRFFLSGRSEVLEFDCRKIGSRNAAPLFVAVAWHRYNPPRREGFRDLFEAGVPAPPDANVPVPSGDQDRRAHFEARVAGRKMARFVWETDANHLTTKVSAELTQIVGVDTGLADGNSLPGRAHALGADADERLPAMLNRHETFSGLELRWPVSGVGAIVPVVLAGQPRFDGQRRFLGHRGFGVIRVDRLSDARPAAAATAEAGSAIADPGPEVSADHAGRRTDVPILTAETPGVSDAGIGTAAIETVVSTRSDPIPEEGAAAMAAEHKETSVDGPLDDPAATLASPIAQRDGALQSPSANPMSLTIRRTDEAPMETAMLDARPDEPAGDLRQHELDVGTASGDDMPATPSVESTGSAAPAPGLGPTEVAADSAGAPGRRALTVSENDAFDELANLLQARLADEGPSEPRMQDADGDRNDDTSPSPVSASDPRLGVRAPASTGEDTAQAAPHPAKDIAAVMERLPMGVLVTRGGVALYANRTLLDLLGHADLDAFHEAGGLDYTLRGRDPGSIGDVEGGSAISVATADGEILNVDGHLQAMSWGDAPAILLSFRRSAEAEIARRVGGLRGELATKENEAAELHAILDTATDGVAVLDKSGLIVSLNRSAEALFGLELSDVIGESFTALLAVESHGAARDYLDGLKKNGVASVLNDGREVIGRAGRRGVIPLFMTIGHLPQHDGMRFCAVMRDLTPWKRAERDLQEARRAAERASQLKSDFLARVSHEIRTPMNAILGFAEVIMEERFGAVGNERYKEYLRDIHSSGVHVMNIVNDLLDLSKIEAGKMELTFASVDANKVVADCVALMQPQAHRERVIIRMALAPRLPNIVADERSLRQMVINILSNAVNFNEAGGQVIVSTALTDSGTAVLRIRDTGIGMSESDLEAALEPFRQLPTARRGTGTGLGLPLTKALADANRASFTIKSKKNEGTLVEIGFPSARVLTG